MTQTSHVALKRLQVFFKIITLVYFLGMIGFLFFPEDLAQLVNSQLINLQLSNSLISVDRFWSVLASSMMMMLCLVAFYSIRFPERKELIHVHLSAKAVSTFGFFYSFISIKRSYVFLVSGFVDIFILLTIILLYWNFMRSLNKKE